MFSLTSKMTKIGNYLSEMTIVIFGANLDGLKIAKKIIEFQIPYKEMFFVDNDISKHGKHFLLTTYFEKQYELKVLSPEILQKINKNGIIIFIAGHSYQEISKQLLAEGFESENHFWHIATISKVLDIALNDFSIICAMWLKHIREIGIGNMPNSMKIFKKVGVFPILDHYYEPLFNEDHLKEPLDKDRELDAIDFNIKEQLELLAEFDYNDELLEIPTKPTVQLEFFYENGAFESGDAEYLYNIIRHFKPKKIIEVGCGNSTLMIEKALSVNKQKDAKYVSEHICIEPYENIWLEKLNIKIIREKVENVDLELFKNLEENDILFIDSSHVIRPQGDVLTEHFKILPRLNKGVFIHIHDIFTPRDYPSEWILKEKRLFNEQYLLEAFLSYNSSFEIIGALNYLHHNNFEILSSKCPLLTKEREPGSFWLRKMS